MDFKHILILSLARTGSTLLQSLLDSHSQIKCGCELLHTKEGPMNAYYNQFLEDKKYFGSIKGEKKIDFLKRIIIDYPHDEHLRYVGFKHIHMQFDFNKVIKLFQNYDGKILYTVRHPIVQFISDIEANRDSIWNVRTNNMRMVGGKAPIISDKMVFINNVIFYNYLNYCNNFYNKMEEMNFFPVYYNELCDNQEDTLESILNYLNLDNEELNTTFKKIRKWDVLSRLKNPEILSQINFTGTRWENIPII